MCDSTISYYEHREYNQRAIITAVTISLTLTIQQVSDFVQVDFKIGDLATKPTQLASIIDQFLKYCPLYTMHLKLWYGSVHLP